MTKLEQMIYDSVRSLPVAIGDSISVVLSDDLLRRIAHEAATTCIVMTANKEKLDVATRDADEAQSPPFVVRRGPSLAGYTYAGYTYAIYDTRPEYYRMVCVVGPFKRNEPEETVLEDAHMIVNALNAMMVGDGPWTTKRK